MVTVSVIAFLSAASLVMVGCPAAPPPSGNPCEDVTCDASETCVDGVCQSNDVIAIDLPAVRDRGDDVILLAEHYTAQFAKDSRKPITGIDEVAIQTLKSYAWPGNVREIRNVIERAVLLSSGDQYSP